MPDCVDTFETEFGYDENSKSKVLPEAGRVGTFTCWVNEESSRTCSSLICCAVVLGLVTYGTSDSQAISPRLKSPPMIILG